jgi:hypothetical protein
VHDPQLSAAWSAWERFATGTPPHELPELLRSMSVPQDVIDQLIERHERETARIIEMRDPIGLGRENAPKWYTGPRSTDKNWPAYEAKLLKSLGDAAAVKRVGDASDKVVAMLDHPGTKRFDSRGLVVGHVQSGKTSNFTAVVCKAADRGYRMFIVLSGVHNALRRQTQARLIQDIVNANPELWHQLTGLDHDFKPTENAPSLLAARDQHLLLVIKKNRAPLTKLRKWLATARPQLENCPTLVIDDEADQATVATKKINPLIRDLLDQLPRVCFVGYTATPFSNLLIDPSAERDFYPRDFVVSLPQGDGYQGPEVLFGRDALDGEDPADVPTGADMIREVPDAELDNLRPAKRADIPDFEPSMTGSLRRAVCWFWLATAARELRQDGSFHSSMLVHAHTDTRVHDSFAGPLSALRSEVLAGLADQDAGLLAALEAQWEEESSRVPASDFGRATVPWTAVRERLEDVVARTRIVRDHYRSDDRLDYDSGPATVIAVGGNTLSRGLTLEGLVVSVFVRSADMYDTLLQMGRWFGYRPRYEDFPRIWMPAEMRQWFKHLASVEAEMRREIERYLVEHKYPLELAVRIRCHPKMRVTAPSRMKDAVRAAASYGGQLIETRYFDCGLNEAQRAEAALVHRRNAAAVNALLVQAEAQGRADSAPSAVPVARLLYRSVPTSAVLDFLRDYEVNRHSTEYSDALVLEYVSRRMKAGGLLAWNVGLVGKAGDGTARVDLPGGRTTYAVTRARTFDTRKEAVADIKTLTGSRDPGLDLTIPTPLPDGYKAISRELLRKLRSVQQGDTGLLLLYPIDGRSEPPVRSAPSGSGEDAGAAGNPRRDRAPLDAPAQIVWGMALVFPEPVAGTDIAVEYDYVQADLSRVFPASGSDDEDYDLGILDEDLDVAAGA